MYPILFEWGGIQITSFGLFMALSFLTGAFLIAAQLKRWGLNPEFAWDGLPWVAIGGVLGAKLYYMALHWQETAADPIGTLLSRGGLVWYGGLFGGVAVFYVLVRRQNLNLPVMFDATAPALALAYAVGRLGCFLVGDDYGMPTTAWYGVAFPEGTPPSTAANLRGMGADIPAGIADSAVLAVHPTQLYEVALALVMFGILWRMASRRLLPGQLFVLYMALYSVERFTVEFVRAKTDRFVFGLSTAQLASILVLALAAYLWQRIASSGGSPVQAKLPSPAPTVASAVERAK